MKKDVKKEDKLGTREVSVLLEDLHSQFRIFGEGLSDVREKLDSVRGMVAAHEEKSTWSRLEIGSIKNELVKINGKLARLENGLKSKADRTEFVALEKKVASLAH